MLQARAVFWLTLFCFCLPCPVLPASVFSMNLSYLAESDGYKECIQNIIKGPLHITLRHRLNCRIIRAADRDESGDIRRKPPEDSYLVLNEVSIDRGMSSFLTFLECYCDNFFVTCVQGDGLIISTTSGSTAYSLAAGGSMVHPQVWHLCACKIFMCAQRVAYKGFFSLFVYRFLGFFSHQYALIHFLSGPLFCRNMSPCGCKYPSIAGAKHGPPLMAKTGSSSRLVMHYYATCLSGLSQP